MKLQRKTQVIPCTTLINLWSCEFKLVFLCCFHKRLSSRNARCRIIFSWRMKKCCSTQAISGVSSLHVWHGTLVLRSGFLLLEKSKDLQTSAVQLKKAWAIRSMKNDNSLGKVYTKYVVWLENWRKLRETVMTTDPVSNLKNFWKWDQGDAFPRAEFRAWLLNKLEAVLFFEILQCL